MSKCGFNSNVMAKYFIAINNFSYFIIKNYSCYMFKVTVFYGEEHGYFFLKNISQYKKQVSIKQNTFKTLCDCEKKIIKKILLNEIILKDESQHAPMCPIFL